MARVKSIIDLLASFKLNEELEVLENDNKIIIIIPKKQPSEEELNDWADEILKEVK